MMALATTLNGNQSAYSLMIAPAAEEGWLPKVFTKTNRANITATKILMIKLFVLRLIMAAPRSIILIANDNSIRR